MSVGDRLEVFNFTNPSEYTLVAAQILAGIAKLSLVDLPSQAFIEDFADDTDFVYDSDESEFVGGANRQKDQRPSGSIAGATYTTDQNLNYGPGTLTGTLNGGATVAGGALICTGGAGRNCSHNANNIAGVTTKGTLRVVVMPNTNTPGNSCTFWDAGVGNLNITFDGSNVRMQIKNDAAGTIKQFIISGLSWTSGVAVELMLAWNQTVDSEVQYALVGGVLKSSDTVVGARTNPFSVTTFNAGNTGGTTSEFDIMEWELYDEVKETTNYTPYYGSMAETKYTETSATFPEMEDTKPGVIQSLDSLVATASANARLTLNIGQSGDFLYWDTVGEEWAVSDGSYAQATTIADYNAHKAELPVQGERYGQFKVHYPTGNDQGSMSSLTATMTLQQYAEYGTVLVNGALIAKSITEILSEVTLNGGTLNVRLEVDGTYKWHNGSAWVTSTDPETESNTEAEFNANCATVLSGSGGSSIRVQFILFPDGTRENTPELDISELAFTYGALLPTQTDRVRVFGYILDDEDQPVVGATVRIEHDRDDYEYVEADGAIRFNPQPKNTDEAGLFAFYLKRSSAFEADAENPMKYKVVSIKDSGGNDVVTKNQGDTVRFSVGDVAELNITDNINAA